MAERPPHPSDDPAGPPDRRADAPARPFPRPPRIGTAVTWRFDDVDRQGSLDDLNPYLGIQPRSAETGGDDGSFQLHLEADPAEPDTSVGSHDTTLLRSVRAPPPSRRMDQILNDNGRSIDEALARREELDREIGSRPGWPQLQATAQSESPAVSYRQILDPVESNNTAGVRGSLSAQILADNPAGLGLLSPLVGHRTQDEGTTLPGQVQQEDTRQRSELSSLRLDRRPRGVNPLRPAYDPDEVLPYEAFAYQYNLPGDALSSDEDDAEADYHGLPTRRSRTADESEDIAFHLRRLRQSTLYSHHNHTGEDIVLGARLGDPASVSLMRGRDNRRRSRIRLLGSEAEQIAEELRRLREASSPLSSESEAEERSNGLPPTNQTGVNAPVLVRSSSNRRPRSNSDGVAGAGSTGDYSSKKQKTNHHTVGTLARPEQKPEVESPKRPLYLRHTILDQSIPLPRKLERPSKKSRLTLSTHRVEGQPSRPCVTFHQPNVPADHHGDPMASSLRTRCPIPVACGIFYYEVEVLDAGQNGYLSVGWMSKSTNLDRLVGWDKGSWGWHGDDGRIFEGRGQGQPFSETWGSRDIVGCGIDFTSKHAFFTKNGKLIGNCFGNIGSDLYPAVGLRTYKESLAINFNGPFKYDIDNHVRLKSLAFQSSILEKDLSPETAVVTMTTSNSSPNSDASSAATDDKQEVPAAGDDEMLPKQSYLRDNREKQPAAFVLDYLRHEGFGKTLNLVTNEMERRLWLPSKTPSIAPETTPGPSDSPSLADYKTHQEALRALKHSIINSDRYPLPSRLIGELDLPSNAINALDIHAFIWLLRGADRAWTVAKSMPSEDATKNAQVADDKAIDCGTGLMRRRHGWGEPHQKLLKEAFGLIGLPVAKWPVDGVSGAKRREIDAEAMYASVSEQRSWKKVSHLEHAFEQIIATNRELASSHLPQATFIDPYRLAEELRQERAGRQVGGGDRQPVDVKEESKE